MTDVDLSPEAVERLARNLELYFIQVSVKDTAAATLRALSARVAELEAERAALLVCASLHMDLTNHHNAAKCPYCNPDLQKQIDREREYKARAEAAEARLQAAGQLAAAAKKIGGWCVKNLPADNTELNAALADLDAALSAWRAAQ